MTFYSTNFTKMFTDKKDNTILMLYMNGWNYDPENFITDGEKEFIYKKLKTQ